MTTVTALLTNKACGYPTRGAGAFRHGLHGDNRMTRDT